MTKREAAEWVSAYGDDDNLDQDELEAAFEALYGRPADDDDREVGLWSLLCAGEPWDEVGGNEAAP